MSGEVLNEEATDEVKIEQQESHIKQLNQLAITNQDSSSDFTKNVKTLVSGNSRLKGARDSLDFDHLKEKSGTERYRDSNKMR